MKFEGIRVRGLGPFREEVSVDFESLPGELVAITGQNGAGKSTILELLAAALYRTTPTRGTLAQLATTRDAFVEARVVNGAPWTIRQVIDGVSGKGEALVLDASGAPVLTDAKVRSFDAWAKTKLPPQEVLFASTFAAQGSAGFLGMSAGERKGVLLRCLGIERYERLAEIERERVRDLRAELQTTDARLADERGRGGDVDAIESEIARLAAELDRAVASGIEERTRLSGLEEEHARGEEARRAEAERGRQRAELGRQLADVTASYANLDTRRANNRAVLADADAIRGAVTRLAEIDAKLAELRPTRERSAGVVAANAQEIRGFEGHVASVRSGIVEAERRRDEAQRRLRDRDAIVDATNRLDALRAAKGAREGEVTVARRAAEQAAVVLRDGAAARIGALRGGLQDVIDHATDVAPRARAALRQDDEAERAANLGQDHLVELQASAIAADRAARQAAEDLLAAERLAVRIGEITAAEQDLETHKAAIERLRGELEDWETKLTIARAEEKRARGVVAAIDTEIATLERERPNVAKQAELAPRLESATVRLAELEPQIESLQAEAQALRARIVELEPTPGWGPPEPLTELIDACRARIAAHEAEHRRLEAARAVREAELATARAAAGRIAELAAVRARTVTTLEDATLLADSLGRTGLQAALIDAAAPELTTLVNDLLHTCVGPRWTVTVELSKLSADGKRELDGCEVRVLDTVAGREAAAETFSGGERVILGEAVSLALSMLACRRSGLEGVTLVRDESGAALDPINARAYVAMLRRAVQLIGARHCLFVSHSPEVQELADARIVVADGKVSVQ